MRECEEKLKSVQLSRASRLDLVAGKSPKAGTRVKHAEKLLHYRTKVLGRPGS